MHNTLDSEAQTQSTAARSEHVVVAGGDVACILDNEVVLGTTQVCRVTFHDDEKRSIDFRVSQKQGGTYLQWVFPSAPFPNTQVGASRRGYKNTTFQRDPVVTA